MPRKLYRFGGMTFVLEADSPIADSPMCEPFRVGAGEPADHTVRLTFSDLYKTDYLVSWYLLYAHLARSVYSAEYAACRQ